MAVVGNVREKYPGGEKGFCHVGEEGVTLHWGEGLGLLQAFFEQDVVVMSGFFN